MTERDYDPLSEETLADPFPAYERLRRTCPVHLNDAFTPPFATLSRYEDVLAGLLDWGLWSSSYGDNPHYMSAAGLFNDPPEHTRFRKLFNRGFTPRAVDRLEGDIAQVGTELIDAMSDGVHSGDFQELYASRLPIIVMSRLMGIPESDFALFREMCHALVATYNVPDPKVSGPPRGRIDAYFQTHVDARRKALVDAGVTAAGPEHLGTVIPDDLISGFVVAEANGSRLADHDVHLMLVLLLLGGIETSAALLGNSVWRLLEEPARWETLKADPSLIPDVVEESLRFDPPVLGLFRTPTRDVELHGVTIPTKHKVMMCFASANRDERQHPDRPDEFLIDRGDDARPHLSFGQGVHFCPGASLARLEARITLGLLIDRLPDLRLDGKPERIVPFILWGRSTLPVAWV